MGGRLGRDDDTNFSSFFSSFLLYALPEVAFLLNFMAKVVIKRTRVGNGAGCLLLRLILLQLAVQQQGRKCAFD